MGNNLAGGQVRASKQMVNLPKPSCSLHRSSGPTRPQHTLLAGSQSQGAGEGPRQQEALLLQTAAVTERLSLQEALLLLLLGLQLLLGARGMPLTLLGLAFCLHPWA